MTAAAQTRNLFLRDDTFFGVCEAIGEDFRFNPNFLRVTLGAGLLWNPLAMIGTYAALGVVVLVSRLLVRNPRPASAKASVDKPTAEPVLPEAANAPLAETLAVAA
jgi:phage shock protein PspC (stress-responsive transcriptional regulator)